MRQTGVGHNGGNVREIKVDNPLDGNQLADALHALAQHVVRLLKGVEEGNLLIRQQLEALVRDDDE